MGLQGRLQSQKHEITLQESAFLPGKPRYSPTENKNGGLRRRVLKP